MKIINAKGLQCPRPLIMTKKALDELVENESLIIQITNETSQINICHYLNDHNYANQVIKKEDIIEIWASKKGVAFEKTIENSKSNEPQNGKNSYVIVFQKDTLGNGPQELGEILIKGFINTLPDIKSQPNTLIFINSGIHLATKGSPVIDALTTLQQKNIEILVCGTCLDYFNKTKDLSVGRVSNMLEIIEKMNTADKIIYP